MRYQFISQLYGTSIYVLRIPITVTLEVYSSGGPHVFQPYMQVTVPVSLDFDDEASDIFFVKCDLDVEFPGGAERKSFHFENFLITLDTGTSTIVLYTSDVELMRIYDEQVQDEIIAEIFNSDDVLCSKWKQLPSIAFTFHSQTAESPDQVPDKRFT